MAKSKQNDKALGPRFNSGSLQQVLGNGTLVLTDGQGLLWLVQGDGTMRRFKEQKPPKKQR